MKVVHCVIYNPVKSFFKTKANEKAKCTIIECENHENCDLHKIGTCSYTPILGWDRCQYGRVRVETGPTKHAQKFSKWIQERQKKYADVPILDYPPKKLAIIGDYVYLPYNHMNLDHGTRKNRVPFLKHSNAFMNGECFLHKDDWTVENVLWLIDFRPQALMGGAITSYQKEEVPLFISHIRELDKKMWRKLIKKRPELDITPNYIGRKAYLKTLKPPITWSTKHEKYPVEWTWDGKVLYTKSIHAYDKTWGDIKLSNVEITSIPDDDAIITIQDNSWVFKKTKFKD